MVILTYHMGLFDFLKGKPHEKTPEEIEQERIRVQKTEEFNKLISKFEFPALEDLCQKILGEKPPRRVAEYNTQTNERTYYPLNRDDYEEFIRSGRFSLEQIKDYAIKYQVVSPSFFGIQTSSDQEKREFENIINTISQFHPIKATLELEHFEPQMIVYLQAKYPDKKIEKQVSINDDKEHLDILIDNKYAFELKVYSNRNQLRDLGAQLEEYKEKYPYLCAVILDNEISETSKANIREYTDKYKVRHNVPCIILKGQN